MNLISLPRGMTASLFVLLVASIEAQAGSFFNSRHQASVFRPTPVQAVFRAQSDGVPLPPDAPAVPAGANHPVAPIPQAGGLPPGPPLNGSTWNAFAPPITSDPFATGPGIQPYTPFAPFGGGAGAGFGAAGPTAAGGLQPLTSVGANGPAPFRSGWSNRFEIEYLPATDVAFDTGDFEQFGVDYELAYGTPIAPGWVLTWTSQFNLRQWQGPTSGTGVPGGAFRFGWDFALETAQPGPVNFKFGLTPSLNSDLDTGPESNAFFLDGRGFAIFKVNPRWDVVLGAGFWDRVNDRVIPYAGVVYRDDFWEIRLLYPESTLSLFLGNEALWSKWAYVRVEHHVEAYEVSIASAPGGVTNVEFEDYRAVAGFRMDGGTYSWFIEAGIVFAREFDVATPGLSVFTPDEGFIVRMGWRY